MVRAYREIRERYRDMLCEVKDPQMFRDILALLRYIDGLHGSLARQAAQDLARGVFEEFGAKHGPHSLTH